MSKITRHTSKTIKRYDITAIVFCIAILSLGLVIGYFHKVGDFGVETDFYGAYAVQAGNILEGRPYTYQYLPPGYSLLLACVSLVTGDFFVAAKIISAFATGIFGWITYVLLRALFHSRIALASTILLLLALIPYSFLVATDIVGAVAIILPLCILLRRPVLTLNACFLSGILSGVAYLVRTNGLFVILGIVFSLLFINLNQETLGKCLVKVGFFICGVLLITSPWFIYNWQTNGSPLASKVYLQIAAHIYQPGGTNSGTTHIQIASKFHSLGEVVLYNPQKFLLTYLTGILKDNILPLLTQSLSFPAYLFCGSGLLLLLVEFSRKREDLSRRRLTFFLVCFFGYLLLGLTGFVLRYYFFLFPFLFLLVTYFLFQRYIFTALGDVPFFRIAVSWILVLILAVSQSIIAYRKTSSSIASDPIYLLEIADFLRNRSSPHDIIIARKPHLAYLSGLRREFPLAETADDFLLKAREIGARYIVYSDFDASLWPGLKSLRDPSALPKSFKLIYSHKQSHMLLYKIDN
jgi:4-amino-4-deoxy-L-arabinose transferase-like glycosyltransferase